MIHRRSLGFVQEMYEWAFTDNRIKGALISSFFIANVSAHCCSEAILISPRQTFCFIFLTVVNFWFQKGNPFHRTPADSLKKANYYLVVVQSYYPERSAFLCWVSVVCVNRVSRVRSVIIHIDLQPPPPDFDRHPDIATDSGVEMDQDHVHDNSAMCFRLWWRHAFHCTHWSLLSSS